MNSDEIALIQIQNKYLSETLLLLIQELARAGMSEYQPEHVEMLELSNWAYILFDQLGIDRTKLEIYTDEILK